MKQLSCQLFESECKKIKVVIDNDTPLGFIHDFLMQLKGVILEKLNDAHNLQVEQEKEKFDSKEV